MKVNLIQKSNLDESFVTKCSYCPQGDMEVSILYSYEAGHYEALIPKNWNLTGESSPQSDRFSNVESKDKPQKALKPQTMKKKKVVEPTIFYFNSWHKHQMQMTKMRLTIKQNLMTVM